MTYWLDLFTPYTWERFKDHGADISGFRPRQRRAIFERVKPGDQFLCYLVKLSRWCGVLEVTSAAFENHAPIFADENDPFSIRFKVTPVVLLDFEQAIPIETPEFWNNLSFTKSIAVGAVGWAQLAGMRQSLVEISASDGDLISRVLRAQNARKRRYKLHPADRRHIAQRMVVRTEAGEIEVEVPEREHALDSAIDADQEIRTSIRMQANVARLGATLGFNIWVPPGDRGRVREVLPSEHHPKLVATLPLNYDTATLKTIENIDVIWLDRRSIARAFEVEHTTAIYSGLLRMADLLTLQPRIQISLHIVAPTFRREQVRREIVRPVFSVLAGGAMAERCSFLSYDALDSILRLPNLRHSRESILEDYQEVFEVS
ncbi:MAG TPA: hypothetical protein VEK35_03100 [Roseiarcus sp.]|nr:hypothetical protein [Roseiarcus sp.]